MKKLGKKILLRDNGGAYMDRRNGGTNVLRTLEEFRRGLRDGVFDELVASTKDKLQLLRRYDEYTYNHSVRVAEYSKRLSEQLSMTAMERFELYVGCLLHDIGKIQTPYEIISKADRLTSEEYEEVKRHPSSGYEILNGMESYNAFPVVLDVALNHHERLDGSGYPNNAKDDEITLQTRIVGITDSFDAMTSNRTYSTGKELNVALDELRRCETSYDQELVAKFAETIQGDNGLILLT